jgi:hypothetical protein
MRSIRTPQELQKRQQLIRSKSVYNRPVIARNDPLIRNISQPFNRQQQTQQAQPAKQTPPIAKQTPPIAKSKPVEKNEVNNATYEDVLNNIIEKKKNKIKTPEEKERERMLKTVGLKKNNAYEKKQYDKIHNFLSHKFGDEYTKFTK